MQFLRFLLTGGIATALQYIVLWLGSEILNWSVIWSSGVGYLAGSVISYLLSYFFTFGSNRSHMQAAPRFYLAVAVGWCINTGVMAILAGVLGWNMWLSQILATCLTIVWNFGASRSLVFRNV